MREINWKELFFAIQSELEAMSRRQFGRSPDTDAAFNEAFDLLSKDAFRRLRDKFNGSGSPEGFLKICFVNELHNYRDRKYGRPHPPTWVKRAGSPWLDVFRMLCLQRMLPESIVDLLSNSTQRDPGFIRRIISEVRGRIPNCGQLKGREIADNTDNGLTTIHCHNRDALRVLEEEELEVVLAATAGALGSSDGAERESRDPDKLTATARQLLKLRDKLELSADEMLLLRMVHQEGLTISETARRLGLMDHSARRTHQRLLRRLRETFEPCGDLPWTVTE